MAGVPHGPQAVVFGCILIFNNNSLACPRSFQKGSAFLFSSFVFFSLFALQRGLAPLSESTLLTVYQAIQDHFTAKFGSNRRRLHF